ncbi:MAG: hypothetical protein PUD55_06295 [Firmicutes bacterium]|nr:hypothetical protein [Bacillota bacterium]
MIIFKYMLVLLLSLPVALVCVYLWKQCADMALKTDKKSRGGRR